MATLALDAAAPMGTSELDVRWLQKRLEMVTEWHERAEDMLAKIQQLPNDARRLRHFTENPEIAMPLLENYDAMILEKEEQIKELQRQLDVTRASVERAQSEGSASSRNARLAEERAHVAIEEAHARLQHALSENGQQKAAIQQLQVELQAARDAASSVVGSETTLRSEMQRAQAAVAEKDADAARLRGRIEELEVLLDSAAKKIKALQSVDAGAKNEGEVAKIQLHLVQKENDDKVHEIERLRNKMVAALKQSAENHEHHLRIVEEKHRNALEQVREQCRTHEVTITKLRAQLAHVDTSGGGASGRTIPSAAEVLASQAHRAQEAEVRRLHAEVTSISMQRDDAVFRLEQLQAARRVETDSKVLDVRKEAELLRIRVHELEERSTRMSNEAQAARDGLRQEREKARAIAAEQSQQTHLREQSLRKLEEARKAQAAAEEALERAQREHHDALEQSRKAVRAADRRAEDARRAEQAVKDRHTSETADLHREVEVLRCTVRDLTARNHAMQTSVYERDRAAEAAQAKADRLSQGLALHKQQISALEERLASVTAGEEAARTELRQLTLHCEHLRMENARLASDRERATKSSEALHCALRGGR